MHSYRFSLRWLFAVVSFAAIGCGLLVYATPFTANLVFSLSLLLLVSTALAAAFCPGQRRAFCVGFAVFGLAYFWLVCGSWQIANTRLRDRLVTTMLLEWCYEHTPHNRSVVVQPGGMFAGGMGGNGWSAPGTGGMAGAMGPGGMPGMPSAPATATTPAPPNWHDFSITGDSLFALLAAALGGALAARVHRKAKAAGMSSV